MNSQTISSLTSGTATPNPLSRPVNSRSLFDALMRVADIQGENPNSGHVSFSTSQSNPLSSSSSSSLDPFSVIGTYNTGRSNISSNSSSIITEPTYNSSDRTYSAPSSSISSVSSTQTSPLPFNSFTSALTDYLTDRQEQPPPMEPPVMEQSTEDESIEIEANQEPPIEVSQIETPPEEDKSQELVIFEQPEPDQQLVVYNPPEKVNAASTATEQIMGIDNSSKPAFLRPMNNPLPRINLKDVITELPGLRGTKTEIREARLKLLEPERPIKLSTDDEAVDIPKFTEEELKNYKEKTKETRQAESTNTETDTSHLDESPELRAFKDSFKNKYRWNWQMGQLLIDNGVKDPKTGNSFYVNPNNKVLVRGSSTSLDKETLKDYLLKAFNDGLINKF